MTFPRSCLVAAGFLFVFTACVSDLANMVTLQKSLLAEYPGTEITVSVNGRNSLQVSMANGAIDTLNEQQEAELARAIGKLVLERYPNAHLLETIAIDLGSAERSSLMAVTRESERYRFTPAQLQAAESPQVELVENADTY